MKHFCLLETHVRDIIVLFQSKIKKRSWVFHECIERIPYNIDAMRELLEFGLKGTDLQALLAIE